MSIKEIRKTGYEDAKNGFDFYARPIWTGTEFEAYRDGYMEYHVNEQRHTESDGIRDTDERA